MTEADKQLLRAAAKAAGHGVEFDDLSGLTFMDSKETCLLWDPLYNDGDAFRLAVKLELCIEHDFDRVNIYSSREKLLATEFLYDVPAPTDRGDATRRAIVRAASVYV